MSRCASETGRWSPVTNVLAWGVYLACLVVFLLACDNTLVHAEARERRPNRMGSTSAFTFDGIWHMQPEEDEYEILYLEFVMASWNLSGTPWNAYHSAIALRPVHEDEHGPLLDREALVADYSPEETEEIRHVVHPDVVKNDKNVLDKILRTIFPYMFNVDKSEYALNWNNKAHVHVETGIDHERYTNITSLGYTSGKAVNSLSKWIRSYNKSHNSFEPLELAIEGKGTVIRSQICHDFITDALWVLHEDDSTVFDPENHVFRDHIVLYATEVEELDSVDEYPELWQSIVSYYEQIKRHMGIINIEFTYARTFFSLMSLKGIDTYLYRGMHKYGNTYAKFKLVTPFINYCYMPLFMPPKRAHIFESPRHCALPQEIPEGDTQHDALKLKDYYFIIGGDSAQLIAAQIILAIVLLVISLFCGRRILNCMRGNCPTKRKKE